MIAKDEDALICDLTETYHIYDYKQLPPTKVAVLSVGLKADSRIKLSLSNNKVPLDTILLAGINDMLNILVWRNTKDGQKGKNPPKRIVEKLLATTEKVPTETVVFNTAEEYENARKVILENIGGDTLGD